MQGKLSDLRVEKRKYPGQGRAGFFDIRASAQGMSTEDPRSGDTYRGSLWTKISKVAGKNYLRQTP